MENLGEIKEQLSNLVFSGKKEEAVRLLQDKYGTNREESEKLLQLALKESITPAKLLKVAGRAVSNLGGGKGCKQTAFKFIGVIMGFLGIPPLLIAVAVYLYQDNQMSNSELITGEVVELQPYTEYGEQVCCTTIINYEFDSKLYTIEAPIYSDTQEFSEGESVELFVLTDNPNTVIINTFAQKWFMVVLIGSIGGVFTFGMMVFLMLSRKP